MRPGREQAPPQVRHLPGGIPAAGRPLDPAGKLVPCQGPDTLVVGVVLDEEPLLVDEPIDLEYVAPADEMTAASVDATTLIVRICDAGGIELDEIVTINGMTWQVVVRELPGGIPAE